MRIALVVVLVPLLQVMLANRLPWPGGVTPDLSMPVALALGRIRGPVTGAVAGFALGLALDVIPPAVPPVGHSALVLCLLGYVGGRLEPAHALAAGVLGGYVLLFGLHALLYGADVVWPQARQVLPLAVPYTILAALPVWILLNRIFHASSVAGPAHPVRLADAHRPRAAVGRADPLRRPLRQSRHRVAYPARRRPARAWGDRR